MFFQKFLKKISKILMVPHYDFSPKLSKFSHFFNKNIKNLIFFYQKISFSEHFSAKNKFLKKILVCGAGFYNNQGFRPVRALRGYSTFEAPIFEAQHLRINF